MMLAMVDCYNNILGVDVFFTEDEYRGSESEQSIFVTVGKSSAIATPLTLMLRPLSIMEVINATNIRWLGEDSCPRGCTCNCQVDTAYGELGEYFMLLHIQCLYFFF